MSCTLIDHPIIGYCYMLATEHEVIGYFSVPEVLRMVKGW